MKTLPYLVSAVALVCAVAVYWQHRQMTKTLETLQKDINELREGMAKLNTPPPIPPQPNPFSNPPTDQITQSNTPLPAYGPTTIQFTKTTHDFGKVKAGEKVKTKFHFKNTGNNPLVISNAAGSCGCTVPSYPRMPLKPGEEGDIDVEFDSSGKRGEEIKTVTVTANTEPRQIVLTIKATVMPAGE
ncbi:MAG: DUF1573 domain-containing protein [Chitinophagales bacterium]|nr:DUF1573 domain-containing protein [Chitinophagales bacterium]MDW8419373.1 DUF1573 domain-containing protein [Chitinophagales bacterium]